MGRAPCCKKMGLKKGQWTSDEDQILISYIRQHGHSNWRALPKQAGLLRCGKSCRLRWVNYLRPDIKRGNFSPEEEDSIIHLHQLLGNRWSAIAARLPGRTDNEIKNVWHTHLKKRLPKPDFGSTAATTTTSGTTKESTKKGVRKCKATQKESISKKLKLEHVNCKDQNNDNNNKNNKNDNNNNNSNNTSDTIYDSGIHAMPIVRDLIFPHPCTSEMSTITTTTTSTSSSTNENEIRGKENVGEKGDYLVDFTEINDDFWMEMLSLEDTAISTQDLPCVCQYDRNTSLDPLMMEPIRLDSSSKVVGNDGDVDFFWNNLFGKIQ